MRTYVIGDIHGCLDELLCLVEALPLEPSDRLIFLGDYVDRGPNSKEVVSYLIHRQATSSEEMIFLKGNHEDMFLSFLGLPGEYGDMFLYNGGASTLASYGASPQGRSREDILASIPRSHLKFFDELKNYYITGHFFCVHAGIHPDKPLDAQQERELFWIRDEFILNKHDLPYTVLFGHTPQEKVLFHLPYKIGLDTGLVYGNELSCLELTQKKLFQIRRGKKKVSQKSVRAQWESAAR
jgi:calcineurin-like phosphoesterase family protein